MKTDEGCADPQDKNERAGKFQASEPICRRAPPRFVLKIIFVSKAIYLLISEANVLKFVWRKISLLKLIQATA